MCKILAKTKDLSKEGWLKLRKHGIGGSDAGAVCGLNPYTSQWTSTRTKPQTQ